ncbi:MAG TPA: transglycosylase SLT domain-containing protein [Thermoanaerobaculia bacterium]|nr:transglycosylase SLT domain-containing protein [Thermoanaerobaculia bacterium]
MRNTLLLAVLGLYAVACATATPAPTPAPTARTGGSTPAPTARTGGSTPAPTARTGVAPAVPAQIDADEFRHELEEAYAHILSRAEVTRVDGVDEVADEEPPAGIPEVDIEAAASIEIPQHRTIDSALRLFSVDMKDSIQTSLLRSASYKNLIDEALGEHELPKGLAYLPVIESAYLPKLTSRAGAHGIWQFMPATAREYGLRVDWWIDERADPERSTRAAAKYLKDLHRMFDGDWSLALAAYNCGPGRVRRTLDEAGAATFWELLESGLLPKETRGYVPTFYATLRIASDPATYGFELADPVEHNEPARVHVAGPVSLEYIAEVTGVGKETLKALNPALRRGVVPPGGASVRVPPDAAATLEARADSLRHEDASVRYCTFRVRKGDTVKRLARAIGAKPETILAMNGLHAKDRLRAGTTLILPVRARELSALLTQSQNRDYFYAVRKGDTLYSIARKNGITVAELRELNDLGRTSTIKPGQKLRIAPPRTMTAGGG